MCKKLEWGVTNMSLQPPWLAFLVFWASWGFLILRSGIARVRSERKLVENRRGDLPLGLNEADRRWIRTLLCKPECQIPLIRLYCSSLEMPIVLPSNCHDADNQLHPLHLVHALLLVVACLLKFGKRQEQNTPDDLSALTSFSCIFSKIHEATQTKI